MNDDTTVQGILRWPSAEARAWTSEFLERARDDRNVMAVVAFGSSTRPGVFSEDLDLVVLCEDDDRFDYEVDSEVDTSTFSVNTVDQKLAGRHARLGSAVRSGVPLFDRNGTWRAVCDRWRDRVPFPDPVEIRKRANKFLRLLHMMEETGDQEAINETNITYLTLLSRAGLVEHGVYPASRPELSGQLEEIGESDLAAQLRQALAIREERLREAS